MSITRMRNIWSLLNQSGLNIIAHSPTMVQHQAYATLEARYESFSANGKKWSKPQRPLELAACGFYWTGQDDRVVCFHCNLNLIDWEPKDHPLKEHIRWQPSCRFLHLLKDQAFVSNVWRQIQQEKSTEEGSNLQQVVQDFENLNIHTDVFQERVDSQSLSCVICLTRERKIVFFPCRHILCCLFCCNSLIKCPICQTPITALVKVYMA